MNCQVCLGGFEVDTLNCGHRICKECPRVAGLCPVVGDECWGELLIDADDARRTLDTFPKFLSLLGTIDQLADEKMRETVCAKPPSNHVCTTIKRHLFEFCLDYEKVSTYLSVPLSITVDCVRALFVIHQSETGLNIVTVSKENFTKQKILQTLNLPEYLGLLPESLVFRKSDMRFKVKLSEDHETWFFDPDDLSLPGQPSRGEPTSSFAPVSYGFKWSYTQTPKCTVSKIFKVDVRCGWKSYPAQMVAAIEAEEIRLRCEKYRKLHYCALDRDLASAAEQINKRIDLSEASLEAPPIKRPRAPRIKLHVPSSIAKSLESVLGISSSRGPRMFPHRVEGGTTKLMRFRSRLAVPSGSSGAKPDDLVLEWDEATQEGSVVGEIPQEAPPECELADLGACVEWDFNNPEFFTLSY